MVCFLKAGGGGMSPKTKKQEALSVNRLINEVLVSQLSIPLRQIVNDTTFSHFTGSKRPDLLISEYEYDGSNDKQYISNLVAYAEAKDDCSVDDKDWKDAIKQGVDKSKKLNLPYFIVTNCKTTYFYNSKTLKQICLNGNPIREFQTIDIFRLIKNRLLKKPELENITTNVDSISTISEAIFNKKLWELAGIYRGINFKDNVQKIDFTIGFVALEYFEEKEELDNKKDNSKIYWSNCNDEISEKIAANLCAYITRLEADTNFNEFKNLMELVKSFISNKQLIDADTVKKIYDIINSMRPLHGTGFDLFGAVYEMFASSKEKKDFGEYFTRRHYTHIFSKLLLLDEEVYNSSKEFDIFDPACGTGGFLTESFKILSNNYEKSGTLDDKAKDFLSQRCFYGIDVREENISRTRLNMFLVGDGHTNMYADNTLRPKKENVKNILQKEYQYIITNPPYGSGTIKAKTTALSSNRTEIAFICKVIELLAIGGKACIITPDGVLENPSYKKLRKEILEKCDVYAIVSLPKFAFAPYTKEKTYALFIKKRSKKVTKLQSKPIWMYIIDNDGLANSDKRFPTKLRNKRNGWMHDEISGWVSTTGEEKFGILESRWLKYDDSANTGTEWIDEKGIERKIRKAGNITIDKISSDEYITMLPEFYLRPYSPHFVSEKYFIKELEKIERKIRTVFNEIS
jgi:type I restriction-modification system DNA methylase subunit